MGVIELKAEVFSNPRKAKKIVDALVRILEAQQAQLVTLADLRNRQEERIKVEYERWISGVRSLKDLIEQSRRQAKLSELARLVESAKTNLVFGLKMKQELVYKLKLENLEDELADFKHWYDILSHRCPTEKDASPEALPASVDELNRSSKRAGTSKVNSRELEKQVQSLKCEYEKLSVKNTSEVSALVSEKEFAWNQYREMESKYTARLQAKNDQLDQVNARVSALAETVEQLHSSSMEKDAEIADLRANLAKMKAEANKKDVQVSRLLEESKHLQNSKPDFLTPVLRSSTGRKAKPVRSHKKRAKKASSLDDDYDGTATESRKRKPYSSQVHSHKKRAKKASSSDDDYDGTATESRKRKPSSSQVHSHKKHAKKASRSDDDYDGTATESRKRKPSSSQDNRSEKKKRVAVEEETPKLFKSNFKIPKLKSSSSSSSHR